jgi:hypothetical protein
MRKKFKKDTIKFKCNLYTWIWIRIFNADPDPASQINADPCGKLMINADPDPNPLPNWTKCRFFSRQLWTRTTSVWVARSFHLLFDMGDSGGLHVAVRTRRLPLHELILCNYIHIELSLLPDGRKFGQIMKSVTEKRLKDRTFYAPKSQKSAEVQKFKMSSRYLYWI